MMGSSAAALSIAVEPVSSSPLGASSEAELPTLLQQRQQQLQPVRPSSQSRLVTPLLWLLIPLVAIATVSWPFLAVGSMVPLLGFVALPSLLSNTVFLLYAYPAVLYLLYAQADPPASCARPFLARSPLKLLKINLHIALLVRDALAASLLPLYLHTQFTRLLILRGRDKTKPSFVRENIPYGGLGAGAGGGRRKLDIYQAVDGDEHPQTLNGSAGGGGAPVVVYLGGGNWSWWTRGQGTQVGMRLRRFGWTVVVPDTRQWPETKTRGMVEDLRLVLEWTAENIQRHGGDPNQIHLMGFGSGAHLSLLTVVQDAVVRSRDAHFATASPDKSSSSASQQQVKVSAGIASCEIFGKDTRLPTIAGLILISGTFDVIKQFRYEAKLGIEEISALRRCCGPSTGASLLSCPCHLLYGAKELIDPTRLPAKFLIIAGGRDTQVPYSQSVLLNSLLVGAGVKDVRLRLYREETHLGSLAGLMQATRYSPMMLTEIQELVDRSY